MQRNWWSYVTPVNNAPQLLVPHNLLLPTFCVEFEPLLYGGDGRQDRQSIHSGLDVGRCAELIRQHFADSCDLVFWRDDEGNHGRSIPGGKTLILSTQLHEKTSSWNVSTYMWITNVNVTVFHTAKFFFFWVEDFLKGMVDDPKPLSGASEYYLWWLWLLWYMTLAWLVLPPESSWSKPLVGVDWRSGQQAGNFPPLSIGWKLPVASGGACAQAVAITTSMHWPLNHRPQKILVLRKVWQHYPRKYWSGIMNITKSAVIYLYIQNQYTLRLYLWLLKWSVTKN